MVITLFARLMFRRRTAPAAPRPVVAGSPVSDLLLADGSEGAGPLDRCTAWPTHRIRCGLPQPGARLARRPGPTNGPAAGLSSRPGTLQD